MKKGLEVGYRQRKAGADSGGETDPQRGAKTDLPRRNVREGETESWGLSGRFMVV